MRHPALFFTAVFFNVLFPCLESRAAVSLPEDKYSAVILAYHRIGEESYPDSNLRTDQFIEQIREITGGNYNVLSLAEILSAIKNHVELPPRTLAITFDGAYKSAYENAIPVLLKENLPFTVFYSSSQVDAGTGEYMSWSDLKKLLDYPNISIGVLPASYARLAGQPAEEIRRQVNKALVRHREITSHPPEYFSYPFGEYSLAYKKIIADAGLQAAFGLQSGAVYEGSDFLALPRFTMTERFGDLERFRLVASALPLPVFDIEPPDPYLSAPVPPIGFSLPGALAKESADMSCFISGEAEPGMQTIGTRVEIRLREPALSDRLRLNCTMPGPIDPETDTPQWRWLGMLLAGTAAPAENPNNPPPDEPQ